MRLKKQGHEQITISQAAINLISFGYIKNKISLVNESKVFSSRKCDILFVRTLHRGLMESTKHVEDNKAENFKGSGFLGLLVATWFQ